MKNLLLILFVVILSIILLVEITNLISFGDQEYWLNHPGYPEGEEYLKAVENGFGKLLIWTFVTAGLLITVVYYWRKRKVLK